MEIMWGCKLRLWKSPSKLHQLSNPHQVLVLFFNETMQDMISAVTFPINKDEL